MKIVSNREIRVSNEDFLKLIFGDEWEKAHITAFPDDPSNISADRRAPCWAGGAASKGKLKGMSSTDNQYFSISLFSRPSERAGSKRRRELFDACFLIVADDVKEKLPLDRVEQLPPPTYKLVTSPGSEQWGWVLDEPCERPRRHCVENLLDGLVKQGLAPNGKDPGMRGVTRYVRLPEGSNTKAKKFVDGRPFKCYLSEWEPARFYSIETLAEVFNIDIEAKRFDTTEAALSEEHPLFKKHPIFEYVEVTGAGASGFLRLRTCVNAGEHTAGDDGAAIKLTNTGLLFYECHHGHCDALTGPKALAMLDDQHRLGGALIHAGAQWKAEFDAYNSTALAGVIAGGGSPTPTVQVPCFALDNYVFIKPRNEFYDVHSGEQLKKAALDSVYKRTHPGGKQGPLASTAFFLAADPARHFADGIGWHPTGREKPARDHLIFEHEGSQLVNTWPGFALSPIPGDVSLWLDLLDYLIPREEEKAVVLDWLACIVQRLDVKPGFCLLHRGHHRIGKDLLYKAVFLAMGGRCTSGVSVENAVKGWGDYIRGAKLISIEEIDAEQDHKLSNAMKTFLAPTATGVTRLNLKGGRVMTQVDCAGYIIMSNYRVPLVIEPGNKRYFVLGSWVEPKPKDYYIKIDRWYTEEHGASKVLNFLLDRDLSGFNASVLPFETEGFAEIVQKSRYDYVQALEEMINDGEWPFNMDMVTTKELRKLMKDQGIKAAAKNVYSALEGLGWTKFEQVKIWNEGRAIAVPTLFAKSLTVDNSAHEVWEAYTNRGSSLMPVDKS